MGQFREDAEQFEDTIEVAEVLETLQALLPGGLRSLPPGLLRAFERDDYSAALSQARELYTKGGPSDRAAALLYASLLTGRGLTDEAAGVLRRALDMHERDVALQLAQVCNLMTKGNWRAAQDLLEGLRSVGPNTPQMWVLMGDIFLELGEDEETIVCYEGALERKSQDADMTYRLARLLFEDERRFDGTVVLERAARIATQDARLWELVAEAWEDLGEDERAVEAWGRVVKLVDDEEDLWLRYAMILRRTGELFDARRALENAIELDPFLHEALLELAHIQFELGYLEDALQSYRRLLKERPDHVEALHGAAAAAYEQGDVGYAEELARKALGLAPQFAESHYNLAVILIELSRREEAARLLEASIEIEPTSSALLALATVTLSAETFEASRALAQRALAACDEDMEERLEEIRLEFAEALVERGMGERARDFMAESATSHATFDLLQPVLEYLSYAGKEEESAVLIEALEERFDRACEAHEAALPLEWDLEGMGRMALRLGRAHKRSVEAMLRRLES